MQAPTDFEDPSENLSGICSNCEQTILEDRPDLDLHCGECFNCCWSWV